MALKHYPVWFNKEQIALWESIKHRHMGLTFREFVKEAFYEKVRQYKEAKE